MTFVTGLNPGAPTLTDHGYLPAGTWETPLKNMRTKHRGKSIRKLASVLEQWMVITPLPARGVPCTAKIILDWSLTLSGPTCSCSPTFCAEAVLCLHIPPPSTCRNTPAWPGILESPCRRRVPQGCSTARITLPAQSPFVGLSEARPFYSVFLRVQRCSVTYMHRSPSLQKGP